MQYTIKSIYLNDKKKSGEPYIDKTGNPFRIASLATESGEKGTMILGNFQKKEIPIIESWKAGDRVEVIFEKSGEFTNFKLPTKTDQVIEKTNSLEDRVRTLETSFTLLKSLVTGKQTQQEIKDEIPGLGEVRLEDIPF